jgi:hypothetical protein
MSLLPNSLGVFIRSTQAKLAGQVNIAAGTGTVTDTVPDTRLFGIGAVYNSDTQCLDVDVAELVDRIGFGPAVCQQAVIGIYCVLDISSDYLIAEAVVTPDMLKMQPGSKSLKMWSTRFNLPEDVLESDLVVVGSVTRITGPDSTDTVSVSCPVAVLDRTSTVHRYLEHYRPQVDASDPHEEIDEVPEYEFTEHTDSESTVFDIDFTQVNGNVVVGGDAVVAYSGGGLRLIPLQETGIRDGDFDIQDVNAAPWLSGYKTLCESRSRNGISDPQQSSVRYTVGSVTASAIQTVQQSFDVDAFPGFIARAFAISGSLAINNTWQYESESAPLSGFDPSAGFLIGSALIQTGIANTASVSGGNRNRLTISVGVRLRDQANNVIGDTFTDYGELDAFAGFDIGSHELGATASVLAHNPGAAYASLLIRVHGVCPGDRCTVTVLAPQIEDGGVAGSRFTGAGSRAPDSITITSPETMDFNSPYGMFTMSATPSYQGAPSYGRQTWFDSRQTMSGPGFYVEHRQTKEFVFGCIDSDGIVTESVLPDIKLVPGVPVQAQLAFNNAVVRGTLIQGDMHASLTATTTNPDGIVVPDMPVICLGSSTAFPAYHFDGEVARFALELRSLEMEQATTTESVTATWE